MKKYAALFMLFFSLLGAKAQYYDIYYGPKVGGNLTHLVFSGNKDDMLNEAKMKFASHIGAFVEVSLNDFFSIQPELLYTVKGARFNKNDEIGYRSAYDYKYLSLPIMAKYYVTKEISVEAGPQFAYLLSAKNRIVSEEYHSTLGFEEAAVDISDAMHSYDLGVGVGAGYLTKSGFVISARYTFGLSNSLVNKSSSTGVIDNLHNGAVQLSVGFSIQ